MTRMTTRAYRTAELCVIAVLLSVSIPFAQAAKTPEQQVLQADTDRFAAMVKGDLGALDKLLAIELTYIHSSARLEDKHAFMYGIKSGGTKYLKIIPTERQVHVMGNVAVVTGVAALHVVDRGQDLDITIRYTNVHVLRDGRWQMVSWQATRLVPTDKVIPGGPA
jgi:ketosteroid isomerase-like protein